MKEIVKLFEDEYLLIAEKPSGVSTQKDKTEDLDLLSYLKDKYKYETLELINRLDKPVGGIVVLGKTQEAIANINKQLVNGEIKKEYIAVVCGEIDKSGRYEDYLLKNQRLNISKIANKSQKDAKMAVLSFDLINNLQDEKLGWLSLIKIHLETGRHHQIRVQCSGHGFPIWGDRKYNSCQRKLGKYKQLGLWANRVVLKHPETKEKIEVCSKPNEDSIFYLFYS